MRPFQILVAATFGALQVTSSMAEDLVVMSTPIGWGDISDFELCKVIIETGGIDCGVVKVPTSSGTRKINYYTAWGPKSVVQQLVKDGGAESPVKWSDELASFFSGVTDTVSVSANGCAAVLIPEGCSCRDSQFGQPIISCTEDYFRDQGIPLPSGEIPWPLLMREIEVPGTISLINGPLISASRDSFEQFRFVDTGN